MVTTIAPVPDVPDLASRPGRKALAARKEKGLSKPLTQAEARATKALHEEKLARAHERIAALLALGKIQASDVGRARSQVRKWADQQICSQWYVDRWSAILAGSRRQIASRIVELEKEDARALFQNTPFGFLVRDFLRA